MDWTLTDLTSITGAVVSILVLLILWKNFGFRKKDDERDFGKWMGAREEFEKWVKRVIERIEGEIRELRDEINATRGELRGEINELRGDVNEIRGDIKKIFIAIGPGVSRQESPLRLTDFGKSISDYLEAQQWAEETAKQVGHEVDGFTAYAIQEWAYRFVKQDDRFPPEGMPRVKIELAAFNYGTELQKVHEVLALELRDELLKLHGLDTPETGAAT